MDKNDQDRRPVELVGELFYLASDLQNTWPEGARVIRDAALALQEEIGGDLAATRDGASWVVAVNGRGAIPH